MKDPDLQWKPAAIGRYRAGDTIRTDRFRFTEYAGSRGKPGARMLYDHEHDPMEDANVAEDEIHKNRVQQLAEQLHQGMGKDTAGPGTNKKE